jgi:hypothetical protein
MADPAETALWQELKIALRWMAQLFGEPAALWEDMALRRDEALSLRAWIAALEALARALLLLMAVRMPASPSARTPIRRGQRKPASAPDPQTDEPSPNPPDAPPGSERWAGVSFRIAPEAPRMGEGRFGRAKRRPRGCLPARALAFRLEALIRVAESPERFARRLARRLGGESALAARILRPLRRRRDRPPPHDDLIEEARSLARVAILRRGSG